MSGIEVKRLNDAKKAYLGIFITLFIVVCIIQIYYVIKFYKNKDKQGYLKRYPNIVMFINVSIVIHVGLYGSFLLISTAHGIELVNYNKLDVHVVYVYAMLANLFYVFSGHGITLGILGRIWIIFYNSKWKQETLVCLL